MERKDPGYLHYIDENDTERAKSQKEGDEMSETMTAEEFGKAEAEYHRASEARRRAEALDALRGRLPQLERGVERCRTKVAECEERLEGLQDQRAKFVAELGALAAPSGSAHHREADQIRRHRADLLAAIAALDGDDARGTLVDHLWNQPRMPRTRAWLQEAQERLAQAERELAQARRHLAQFER